MWSVPVRLVVRRAQQAAGLREAERLRGAAHAARLPDARHKAVVGRQLNVRQARVDNQLIENKTNQYENRNFR